MLSMAARLPRICLVCRLGILHQAAAVPIRCPPGPTHRRQIRYASDFSLPSKERVEALISGALDDFQSHSKGGAVKKRRLGQKKKSQHRGAVHDEPAESAHGSSWSESCNMIVRNGNNTSIQNAPIQESWTNDEPSTTAQPKSMPKSQPPPETKQLRDEFVYRQSLGIDALGKSVDAIIIKNPNKIRDTTKLTTRDVKEAQHVKGTEASFTWQDIVPQEKEVDESGFSKEIWENIDEIRPRDGTIIRRKDFDKLIENLVDGFTARQLGTYFNRANWGKILGNSDRYPYSWITEQNPWAAAEPLNWSSHTPKQRQAVAILTGVWKLEIQENIEGFGGAFVWLKPDIFSLVASPQSGIIGQLSADFLDKSNKERITTRAEDFRIGIYTRKPTVATILARLDEIVQTINSQTISVERVKQEYLETSVLMELEKITKTALTYNTAGSTLDVSWLAETDVSNGKTEGPADIVLRLLIGRETPSQHLDAQILSTTTKSKNRVFLTHQRDKRSMAWKDKLQNWSRYVHPIGISTEKTTEPLGLSTNISLDQPKAKFPKETTEVTAVFGHILHADKSIDQITPAESRRILSPVIPHPAALTLITADTPAPSTQKTAIVLNFAPESPQATPLAGITPVIRLRLPINPFTDLSNFSFPDASVLEAVIPWQESDIMLPDNSVDVRLTQKRLIPLDANQHSLQAFLQDCDFNLLQGRLRTPSRTSFAIPSFTSTKLSSSSTGLVTAPYMFMGLEIHQTIDMEWQSHTLRYSSIEAGQHGGQQQMLSLVAGPPTAQGSAATIQRLSSFLELVEETACGAHFSWDEGHKLMSQRSTEQFSWDMMDTEYAKQDPTAVEDKNQQLGPEHAREGQEAESPDQPQQTPDTISMANGVKRDGDDETLASLDEAHHETKSTTTEK